MRVGWIVENRAAFVCEEARALADHGVEARVASVFRPDSPEAWERAYGAPVAYPSRGRARWAGHALRDASIAPATSAALLARAHAFGAPLRLVALALRLAGLARAEGWAHVHASFASQPAFVAWAVARLSGLPWSLTGHAYDVQQPMPWLAEILPEASFARAISRETAGRLEALAQGRLAGGCVRVGYLGVDLARFRAMAPCQDPDAPVLSVANLVAPKGLDVLIDATARLHARGCAPRVRILGDGPERARLAARIREAGLEARISLEGHASREQVRQALAQCALFALPCVVLEGRRHDGIPVALLEAMASQRAVITTPVGGVGEVVDSGRNGLLVRSGDARVLADAMAELLDAPLRRARLGRAAREQVEQCFSLARSSARLARWLVESAREPVAA